MKPLIFKKSCKIFNKSTYVPNCFTFLVVVIENLHFLAQQGQDIHISCNRMYLHYLHNRLHHPNHIHNCCFHHHTIYHLSSQNYNRYQYMEQELQQWWQKQRLDQDINNLCSIQSLHHLHNSLHHPIHIHNCCYHHHTIYLLSTYP